MEKTTKKKGSFVEKHAKDNQVATELVKAIDEWKETTTPELTNDLDIGGYLGLIRNAATGDYIQDPTPVDIMKHKEQIMASMFAELYASAIAQIQTLENSETPPNNDSIEKGIRSFGKVIEKIDDFAEQLQENLAKGRGK